MAVFLVYPVMPPRLLPSGRYVDTVGLAGFSTTSFGPISEDQYGAMPSLHVAWALWVGIVLMLMLRRHVWRYVALAYPAATTVAVLVTGNHYVLDVVAGVLTTLLAFRLSKAIGRARRAEVALPGQPVAVPAGEMPGGLPRQRDGERGDGYIPTGPDGDVVDERSDNDRRAGSGDVPTDGRDIPRGPPE